MRIIGWNRGFKSKDSQEANAVEMSAMKTQLIAYCLRRSAPTFLPDGGDTDLVKLSLKRLNSFGSAATVFQFERCPQIS